MKFHRLTQKVENEEVAAGKHAPSSEIEREHESVRVDVPLQKGRLVIRVESDETVDYVSGRRRFGGTRLCSERGQ